MTDRLRKFADDPARYVSQPDVDAIREAAAMREALVAIRTQIAKGPNPSPLDTVAKIDLLASQALAALTEDET